MSIDQGVLTVKLEGDGVSPESVGISDLGKLLAAVAEVVKEAGGKPSEVSLTSVTPGSVAYGMASSADTSLLMADVITSRGSDGMSSAGPDMDAALRKVQRAIPAGARLLLRQEFKEIDTQTVLEPEASKKAAARVIRGYTTVYGEVSGIIQTDSGANARMRQLGDQRVLMMSCSTEIGKRFGALMFQSVRVEGLASWATDTLEITGIEVDSVKAFEPSPFMVSLQKLSDYVGRDWAGKDAVAVIREMRGEDE